MSVHTHAPIGSDKREVEPSAATSTHETTWELVDFDRYVVTHHGPVGYVDVVPPVFVCHLGHPYAKAVEIAQVYDLERAVQVIAGRAAFSHGSQTAS